VSERPANDEMVQGFRDGYDLTVPIPSANRSASYRHGFMCGRLDRGLIPRQWSSEQLTVMADQAMNEDVVRAIQ